MSEGQGVVDDVKRVRRLLDQIVRRHPDTDDVVAQINAVLDRLPHPARRQALRRTGAGVRYEIRVLNKQQALYEVRPAGAPLRVGQDLFDAMVTVMAAAAKPLSYDEIAQGVESETGATMADWQGRVLLRFFQQANPPLVIRGRSRYRAADPSKVTNAARKLWASLPKG